MSKTQSAVNKATLMLLATQGKAIEEVHKSIYALDTRLDKLERWVLILVGIGIAVGIWWEVQLKDTLFPRESNSESIKTILHEIKSMKAVR